MKIQEFGEQGSNIVLIQPVDDHDLAVSIQDTGKQ